MISVDEMVELFQRAQRKETIFCHPTLEQTIYEALDQGGLSNRYEVQPSYVMPRDRIYIGRPESWFL